MNTRPRVALFCETFHEINGVALTARQLAAFASRHDFPLLAIHGGSQRRRIQEGSVTRLELTRSWASVPIESDLKYDFFFWRYLSQIRNELQSFRPDVIHITSPGEIGQLGVYLSRKLRIPLVASWHTNFHQFLARRFQKLIGLLPQRFSQPPVTWSQEQGLRILLWFYGLADVTLAPTQSQVDWLTEKLRKPSFLMPRGVDCEQFDPRHRTLHDDTLRLGFVGRVTPEKGVRVLAKVEKALESAGLQHFRILIVGDGSEMGWLKSHLKHGDFAGVLRERPLAQAYANMDIFVFPSRTDTFGNVIQEAAASGVPSVVTDEGGPKNLVNPGGTGCVVHSEDEFVASVVELASDTARRQRMGIAAREKVTNCSWDAAFEMTYRAYLHCLTEPVARLSHQKKVLTSDQHVPLAS
jgi:phosphatidylinositol alpha 1,6-mannosyltransferase